MTGFNVKAKITNPVIRKTGPADWPDGPSCRFYKNVGEQLEKPPLSGSSRKPRPMAPNGDSFRP